LEAHEQVDLSCRTRGLAKMWTLSCRLVTSVWRRRGIRWSGRRARHRRRAL